MNRIAALNSGSDEESEEDSSSRQPATKEAQESEAFALHTRALVLQKKCEIEEAKEILIDLIQHPLIQQCSQKDPENVNGPGQLLKYSTYKNLAVIATQEKKWEDAMDYYQEAVMVDATDVTVWYKMGIIALELHNYPLARHAFEEALECNQRHWPSLDKVITVLYALGDYANCLRFISKALQRDNGYLKGHCFLKQIHHEAPSLQLDMAHFFKDFDSSVFEIEIDQEEIDDFVQEAEDMRIKKRQLLKIPEKPVIKFRKPLASLSWKDLGECIVDLYDSVDEKMNRKGVTDITKPQVTLTCKVDLSQYKDLSPDQDLKALNTDSPAPAVTETNNSGSGSAKDSSEPMDTAAPASGSDGEGENGKMEDEVSEPTSSSVSSSIKKAPGSKKGPKGKKEWWYNEALKRRSSRVRNTCVKKSDEAKIDYGELIKKLLPQALLVANEDEEKPISPECTDSTNQNEESKMDTTELPSSQLLQSAEKDDVLIFLKSHETNYGVLQLVNDFLFELMKREKLSWTQGLGAVYIKAYERFRRHFDYPNFLCKDEPDDYIHDMAMMCLVLSELKLDSWLSKKNQTPSSKGKGSFQDHFGEDFIPDLEYLIMLTPFQDILADDWFSYTVRVFWCRARYMVVKNNNDMAITAFERVVELFETRNEAKSPAKLSLFNCQCDTMISKETAVKHMEALVCTQSLDEVQKKRSSGDHEHVVDLLIQTFKEKKLSTTNTGGRHEQLLLLQDSLLKLKDNKKSVTWIEVSLNEAIQHYYSSHKESSKDTWLSTIAKLTDGLETCLKKRECYKALMSKNRCRLTENLLKLLEIAMEQPESGGDLVKITVMPWILLYWLIKHEEDEQKESGNLDQMLLEDDSLEENMPSSLMILNLAHEYVSRQSRCTILEGKLLLYTIDRFTAELKSAEDEDEPHAFKEEIHNAIEQCFLCLYSHPNKRTKTKHLQDHNAPPVQLSWERCVAVFNYFKPKSMPEYDSYRTSAVSAELENLLRRIFHLIPPSCATSLTVDCIGGYIEGTLTSTPSLDKECKLPIVNELYYLLADYYFKTKEQGKAIKFYMLDLTINPERFDSWAGMALARSSKLEQKLNSHELKNEPGSINKHSVAALKCFKRALELDSSNGKLWIEYGSLAYQLHSHASRQLKQQHMFPLGEFLETAESNRQKMLELARKCYSTAGECDSAEDGQEELWLQHYMMGKISEKLKLKPQEYLKNYRKAAEYLHEDRAKYPKKINYIYSPPHLAVESLEIHFRLHASIIKYLSNNYMNGDEDTRLQIPFEYLEKIVKEAAESGFALGVEKDRPKRAAAPEIEATNTSGSTSGVGRPRKRSKIHHPDHTYSKAKVSSESSQESCDVACSSPAIVAQADTFTPTSIMVHSPASSSTFPFPTVRHQPANPEALKAPDSSPPDVIPSQSAPQLPPILEKAPVESRPPVDDGPPLLTKSESNQSIPELTKECELLDVERMESESPVKEMVKDSDEIPAIDRMESPTKMLNVKETSNELPTIDKMESPSRTIALKEASNEGLDIDRTESPCKEVTMKESSIEMADIDKAQSLTTSPLTAVTAEGSSVEKPETAKESSNDIPELDKMESPTQAIALTDSGNGGPSIGHTESFDEQSSDAVDEIPVMDKMELSPTTVPDDSPPPAVPEKIASPEIKEKEQKEESEVMDQSPEVNYQENGDDIPVMEKMTSPDMIDDFPAGENMELEEWKKETEHESESVEAMDLPKESEASTEKEELVPKMEDETSEKEHVDNIPDIDKIDSTAMENNDVDLAKSSPMPDLEKMEEETDEKGAADFTEPDMLATMQLDGAFDGEEKKGEEKIERTDEAMETDEADKPNSNSDKIQETEAKNTESIKEETDIEISEAKSKGSVKDGEQDKKNYVEKCDPGKQDSDVEVTNEATVTEVKSEKDEQSVVKPELKEKETAMEAEPEVKADEKPVVDVNSLKERYHKLMWRCMQALELCLSRFPQHYKSLYHLARIYAKSDFTKHLQWARDLLLGPQDDSCSWQQLSHMPCPGLFQDRKNTNFFNGLWRIPIEEIDRSGSFTSHLSQSIHLLYDVLTELDDSHMLFKLCTQLAKTPEQGKKYLRDLERVYLSRQAYIRCLAILEKEVANYSPKILEASPDSKTSPDQKFLLHIHKVWRHGISQQIEPKRTNRMFGRAYSAVTKNDCNPNEATLASLLEQAIKHCQEVSAVKNPGPGRPKMIRTDEKKKTVTVISSSEIAQKRPSTPSRPVVDRSSPKPSTPVTTENSDVNSISADDEDKGNASDSSYKASDDSESSSASEDEPPIICISDSSKSPIKNYPKQAPLIPGNRSPTYKAQYPAQRFPVKQSFTPLVPGNRSPTYKGPAQSPSQSTALYNMMTAGTWQQAKDALSQRLPSQFQNRMKFTPSQRPSSVQSKPPSSVQYKPSLSAQSKPSSLAQSKPSATAQSKPSAAALSKPPSSSQSKPPSLAQSKPPSSSQSKPPSSAQSKPPSSSQSKPPSLAQSKPPPPPPPPTESPQKSGESDHSVIFLESD